MHSFSPNLDETKCKLQKIFPTLIEQPVKHMVPLDMTVLLETFYVFHNQHVSPEMV